MLEVWFFFFCPTSGHCFFVSLKSDSIICRFTKQKCLCSFSHAWVGPPIPFVVWLWYSYDISAETQHAVWERNIKLTVSLHITIKTLGVGGNSHCRDVIKSARCTGVVNRNVQYHWVDLWIKCSHSRSTHYIGALQSGAAFNYNHHV